VLNLIASQNNSNPDSRYKSTSPTPSSSTNTDSGHSDTLSSASLDGTSSYYQPLKRQHSAVRVNILPECSPWSASFPIIDLHENGVINIRLTAFPVDAESDSLAWNPTNIPTSDLRSANPTVVFASPYVLYPHASFSVFRDGENEAIYTEFCQLLCHPPTHPESGWLYTSALVPGYWNVLSRGNFFPVHHQVLLFNVFWGVRCQIPRSTPSDKTFFPLTIMDHQSIL
jgi:hypothetical protein